MINNYDLIRPLLKFDNEGDFYFIQVIKRRKDNPGLSKDNKLIDNFYVYSMDEFNAIEHKLLSQCELNNARAYMRLNVRNAKKVGLFTLKKITDYIISNDYRAIASAYHSTCGEYHSDVDKKWVVDIDGIHLKYMDVIKDRINELHSKIIQPTKQHKILATIPTKTGFHIITNPFNVSLFKAKYVWGKTMFSERNEPVSTDGGVESPDVHKDNPTVLITNP